MAEQSSAAITLSIERRGEMRKAIELRRNGGNLVICSVDELEALLDYIEDRDSLWAALAEIASHDLHVDYADVELRRMARLALGMEA